MKFSLNKIDFENKCFEKIRENLIFCFVGTNIPVKYRNDAE